nr:CRISPR-associated helicase Cas3' [Microcella alkalica]
MPWAKSDRTTNSSLLLWRHMADSAAVAGLLWDEWLPRGVIRRLSADLHDEAQARRRLVWLAASHDLGKATAAFQMQVPELCEGMRGAGFDFHAFASERALLPHSLASMHLLGRWLEECHGWNREVARSYAVVPGSHHGVTPTNGELLGVPWRPTLIGEAPTWRLAQDGLAGFAAALAGVTSADFADWSRKPLGLDAQILITATVIVADWLASDSERFRYDDHRDSLDRAADAWQDVMLTPAWHPLAPPQDAATLYAERFDLPAGATPRPVQLAAVEVAWAVDRPGLMIIEAPMGEGKTEAALAAAEIFAERSGAGGCFVALPTMATSDAMFSRVRAWIDHLPAQGDARSLFLAHSKASLNKEFTELRRDSRLGAIGDDAYEPRRNRSMPSEVVIAHQWLSGRKKGPLSNFVVGTIDQILFAALRTRHLMLRHLALVGKVVIIDEVHAVDVYMSTYLERVLHWLGAYGVPTVLLSATLPSAQRKALLEAYRGGTSAAERVREKAASLPRVQEADGSSLAALLKASQSPSSVQPVEDSASPLELAGYPLITATRDPDPLVHAVPASGRATNVTLERLADDDASLLVLLRERLADGGCAVVIRNTVGRAQETMRLLENELDLEVDLRLMHSRFVAADRARNDEWLRTHFGPPGLPEQFGERRPHRAVIVATQVVEQSLDIDFDLMVTDLAPTDLLLQRIGRLHRHPRSHRPAAVAEPRCLITGVENWATAPPELEKRSAFVYGDYTLLRSLVALDSHLAGQPIALPSDIPRLVEAAFEKRAATPAAWSEAMDAARRIWKIERAEKEERAKTFLLRDIETQNGSLLGWLDRGIGDANEERGRAQVRDSEDTLEVILVQGNEEELRTLDSLPEGGGRSLPIDTEPPYASAVAAANSSTRLPGIMSKPWNIDAVIRELERNAYPGWQQSRWLSGQLVVVLDDQLRGRVGKWDLQYSRERGLEVTDSAAAKKEAP